MLSVAHTKIVHIVKKKHF